MEFDSRMKFENKYPTAYEYCRKNKWLDDVCSHMKIQGNLYMKFGYKMIFTSDDKEYIYIGFTSNFERRIWEHLNLPNDTLYKSIKKYNLIHKNSFIYHDTIKLTDAKNEEIKNIEFHRNENKYIVLNNSNGGEGGFGPMIKYTKNICKEIFKDCKTITEARKINLLAYENMRERGWLYELFPDIQRTNKPPGYWNDKNNCKEAASECKNRKSFRKKVQAYNISSKNGWLDEFFPDTKKSKPAGYWNDKQNMIDEIKKYNTKSELRYNNRVAYEYCKKNNWIDEFFNYHLPAQ